MTQPPVWQGDLKIVIKQHVAAGVAPTNLGLDTEVTVNPVLDDHLVGFFPVQGIISLLVGDGQSFGDGGG